MMDQSSHTYPGIQVLRQQFYMVKKLGGGAFGTVYLVQRKESKEMLAAKHQKANKAAEMKYIRRELDILHMLSESDTIVRLVDYFESSLQSIILTEYLTGGELFERISSREYNLTEEKCREFVTQVVTGLIFIHGKGVLHLDMKPNNIVCVSRKEEDLRIKIIDFGLARCMDGEQSIPITTCGTPEFMSPEVMKCTRASPASDMWSLGVIIFMMVTGGFSPFYSHKQLKMQRKILRGNYNIEHQQFASVSREAKDIVRALLVVVPSNRMTTVECHDHKWLGRRANTDNGMTEVRRLETQAMRRWLARRRWIRACHIVRATIRLTAGKGPGYLSSEEEIWI